jgi:C1A family cysteine protease
MFQNIYGKFRLGWNKDYPDVRDYNLDDQHVSQFVVKSAKNNLAPSGQINVDLPPMREQFNLGSCTAHSGTYLFEIHQRVANLGDEPMSRLFLYKTTRQLAGMEGDCGAFLRTTMQAIAMFGIVPESYYPYHIEKYDDHPLAFHYAIAQNYQALTYYRLDPYGTTPEQIISRVKANININRACMFGFVVYGTDDKNGHVLLPNDSQQLSGGHAVVVVSYDDNYEIVHPSGRKTIGAFKFANWWGKEWGQGGFGWLPYDFVRMGIAVDWWTMMTTEWLDLRMFR